MRIGLDIDGVLNDVGQFELEYGSKYYIENNHHLINPDGFGSYEIFDGTENDDDIFWKKAIYDFIKYPARNFAAEVIDKLKARGHEIFIVTARISDLSYCDITPQEMKKIVFKWLKKHHIKFDEIIWTGKDKVSACVENKIDILVDDNPKHINNVSKKIPVICFDTRYNKNCNGENITRCYTWYDIYDKIENLINI